MTLPRFVRACAAAAAVLLAAGCAAEARSLPQPTAGTSTSAAPTSAAPAPSYSPTVTTREMTDGILTDFYLPDRMATLRVPATQGPAPLAVVIPGGGWATADPVDYRPLAESLTASGISTSLITYSTTATGAQFPLPIDDVACAARWSAFQLAALGYPTTEIYLIGHSAGGQLAMEVAVATDRFGGDCPMPPVRIDGVVGLAGVYDLFDAGPELFPDGGTPEERARFGPIATVNDPNTSIPALKVMILSGSDDVTVPATQPEQLAAAFRARGIDPNAQVLPLPHNIGFPLAIEIAPIIKAFILGDAYVPPTPTPTPTPEPPPPAEVASPAPPADPAAPPPASGAPPAPPAESVAPPAGTAAPVASAAPAG